MALAVDDLFIVLDTSGSMDIYKLEILKALRELCAGVDTRTCVHFITFSDRSAYADAWHKIVWDSEQTNIVAGLQMLEAVAKQAGNFVQSALNKNLLRVVLFISDGEHNAALSPWSCTKALEGVGDKSVLMAVAVGKKFPTAAVIETLRPLYHRADTHQLLPSVFALDAVAGTAAVFATVLDALKALPGSLDPVPITTDMAPSDLMRALHQSYRVGAVKLTECGDIVRSVGVATCKRLLRDFENYAAIAKARWLRGAAATAEERECARRIRVQAGVYAAHVVALRCSLLNAAGRGEPSALCTMSNELRRDILSFGAEAHVQGYYSAKAAELLPIRHEHNMNSLIDFIKAYRTPPDTPKRVVIMDQLTLRTEEELFADIQWYMSDMPPFAARKEAADDGPVDAAADEAAYMRRVEAAVEARRALLLEEFPTVFHFLREWPLSSFAFVLEPFTAGKCEQVDLWRVRSKGLPVVMKNVDTCSFVLNGFHLDDGAEYRQAINALVLRSRNAAFLATPFAAAVSTYLLCRNAEVFQRLAVHVGFSLLAFEALRYPPPLPGHGADHLLFVIDMHERAFGPAAEGGGYRHPKWTPYVEALERREGVWAALAPECTEGGVVYKCSDFKKYVLAAAVAAAARLGDLNVPSAGSRLVDPAHLTLMRDALVVELYSRARGAGLDAHAEAYFHAVYCDGPKECAWVKTATASTLNAVADAPAAARPSGTFVAHLAHVLPNRRLFLSAFAAAVAGQAPLLHSLEAPPDEMAAAHASEGRLDTGTAYWQFTPEVVANVFENLAQFCTCHTGPHLPPLDPPRLLACMWHAVEVPSPRDRAAQPKAAIVPLAREVVAARRMEILQKQRCAKAAEAAPGFAAERYSALTGGWHAAAPCVLPRAFVTRLAEEEPARAPAALEALSLYDAYQLKGEPCVLSRTACMCVACPFAFAPIAPGPGRALGTRAPCRAAALAEHLCEAAVPGFHKALSASPPDASAEELALRVVTGSLLRKPDERLLGRLAGALQAVYGPPPDVAAAQAFFVAGVAQDLRALLGAAPVPYEWWRDTVLQRAAAAPPKVAV